MSPETLRGVQLADEVVAYAKRHNPGVAVGDVLTALETLFGPEVVAAMGGPRMFL